MNELLEVALIEAGAIAIVVGLLIEAVKSTGIINDKKWLPLLSLAIGIICGLIVAVVAQEDILVYALAGLVGGGFASGIYDNVKSLKGGK